MERIFLYNWIDWISGLIWLRLYVPRTILLFMKIALSNEYRTYDLRDDFGIWMAAFLCFGTVIMCKHARLMFNDQNIYLSGVWSKKKTLQRAVATCSLNFTPLKCRIELLIFLSNALFHENCVVSFWCAHIISYISVAGCYNCAYLGSISFTQA